MYIKKSDEFDDTKSVMSELSEKSQRSGKSRLFIEVFDETTPGEPIGFFYL